MACSPPSSSSALAAEPDPNRAAAITEVTERVSVLVREEIELAKAEITQKVTRLVKGAVVAAAAGVFILAALLFGLHGVAWLLYYLIPIGQSNEYFWGFFFLAVILVVLAGVAGLLAFRLIRSSSPPVPTMAIDEAKLIRESVRGEQS